MIENCRPPRRKVIRMEDMMSKVMFQFRHKDGHPALDQIRQKFGLTEEEVDSDSGVVQSDREKGLYVVMVEESAQSKIRQKLKDTGEDSDPAVGVFSNPRIDTFGPPES